MTAQVVCAWCERDGVLNILRVGDPMQMTSHGCCARHEAEFLQQLAVVEDRALPGVPVEL